VIVDILITNIHVFNSIKRTFERKNVSIIKEKFYYISNDDLSYLQPQQVIDGQNQYMIPGFVDSHMHIESSMTTPSIFSKAVLPYGVTTVVADTHEIANVAGIQGIYEFLQAETELDIFYAIPSSVPSTTPELETTGGIIGLAEVKELLAHPKVICLGEAMNFKGITSQPESLIRQMIALCQKERPTMPLEGHVPKIAGEELAAFMYSGITSDHTHQFPESLEEKINAGMFIQFQEKSITRENMAIIRDNNYYDYACLVTDDVMADDLCEGHLNKIVLKAVEMGLPLEQALYMASYTPSRRMGLHDRGLIAPGRYADFMLVSDLTDLTIEAVYKSGACVYVKGDARPYPAVVETFPEAYYHSVVCRELTESDLTISAPVKDGTVLCHAIRKQEVGTFTELVKKELPVKNGILQWEDSDCCLLIVLERYGKNGNISVSLIEKPIDTHGSIATTWAHDHHNMMIMGNNKADILTAQKRLLEMQGGYVVVKNQEVIGECCLPIGGILSQEPIDVLGEALHSVRRGMVELGYRNVNEIMSFSTLSLPVSPQVKVTDVGMMDTKTHEFYPMFVGELT